MQRSRYPYKFDYLSDLKFHYKELHQEISHDKLTIKNSHLLIIVWHLYQEAECHLHNYLIISVIVLLAPISTQHLDIKFKESRIDIDIL
jgi:hypothetical protein